jgi:hypothetical protein
MLAPAKLASLMRAPESVLAARLALERSHMRKSRTELETAFAWPIVLLPAGRGRGGAEGVRWAAEGGQAAAEFY